MAREPTQSQTADDPVRARLEHTVCTLQAVRRVNQLITRTRGREALLQGVCECLVETRGYFNAWIALLDENRRLTASYEAGLGELFCPLVEKLSGGELTRCGLRALTENAVVAIEDVGAVCTDCPLAAAYSGRAALTAPIASGDRVYGILSASIPASFGGDEVERSLFAEVAADLGYALHALEQEERRRAAEALLRLHRHITASLPHPVAFVDAEYRYQAVNEAYANYYGVPPAAIEGRSVQAFLGPAVFDGEVKPHLDRCLAGEAVDYEVEISFPGFDTPRIMAMCYRPYRDGCGAITGVVSQGLDITALRRSQEQGQEVRDQLRETEARYRAIVEQTGDAMLVHDFDGHLVDVNECACQLYGYRREEFLTLRVCDLDPDYAEREAGGAFWEGMGLYDPVTFEARQRTKGGDIFPVEVRLNLVRWEGETRVLGLCRDITERHETAARLRHMEKMDAVGQLAGGVAHDFNNQLSAVLGYAEMLHSRLEEPDLQGFAEVILTAARRSADLTHKLLAFSRKGAVRAELVDMHNLVDETVAMLRRSVDKRIRVNQRLKADRALVVGDPSQLQNALLNLAINARDAMPRGGELTFLTAVVTLDSEAACRLGENPSAGPHIEVAVRDTGEGIPPEVQKHLFEPFFTTKESGEGTGMGLASVYGAATQHGGAVRVKTAPGMGSTFTLTLPLAQAVPEHRVAPTAKSRPDRPLDILIVDDEELVRGLAGEMLRAAGHRVRTVEDGAVAVEVYRQHGGGIDLVLLDMIMPHLDGRDTFHTLRAIDPAVKVVLSSGYSVDNQVRELIEAGVCAFVQKPFDQADLVGAVESAALQHPHP